MTESKHSSVIYYILAASKWSLSFGGKLLSIVPFYTSLVVLLTLVSQISMLLAFFLPLKVLLLLGSPDIPSYFRDLYGEIGRNELVAVLASGSAVFYLLYLLAEWLVISCNRRASIILLEKSRKITLFPDQEELAARTYDRYSRSLAGLVFITSALSFIVFLYPTLAATVLLEVIAGLLIISIFFRFSQAFRDTLHLSVNGLMKVVGSVGFLLAFFFMLVDALLTGVQSIIVLIVCLLLIRQLMGRLTSMVVDLTALYKQRVKINALFFHGKKLYEVTDQSHEEFWSLFRKDQLDIWIPDLLLNLDEVQVDTIDVSWRSSGIVNIVLLSVTCNSSDRPGTYFLKLFNKGKASLALHEESLMSECGDGQSPFPHFVGSRIVQGYHCHTFYTAYVDLPDASPVKRRTAISRGLLTFSSPAVLLESYVRSRPQLDQRLNSAMVERLRISASTHQHRLHLCVLEKNLLEICSRLQSLPLKLFNPDAQPEMMFFSASDTVHFLHWGSWSVEPIGAGWPFPGRIATESDWEQLDELLDELSIHPCAVSGNFKDNVKLAGLMYSFEGFYARQKYLEALDLLPLVLSACKFPSINNL